MDARTTKLRSSMIITEDVSLVASKKEPPKSLAGGNAISGMASRPVLNEKEKEIKNIERNKRMSCVQTVGKKVWKTFSHNGKKYPLTQLLCVSLS